MESLTISWRELLFVLVVVLAVYVAEMLLLLRMRKDKGADESVVVARGVAEMRQELAEMRRQLDTVHSELEQLKKKSEASVTPYSQAIQLARQGREAAEVASSCGISRGEAELIVALYRDS